jgi:hypothetical protein
MPVFDLYKPSTLATMSTLFERLLREHHPKQLRSKICSGTGGPSNINLCMGGVFSLPVPKGRGSSGFRIIFWQSEGIHANLRMVQ